jgi:DNA mismatch repair protein MutL
MGVVTERRPIRVLTPLVASQIAAGEVVERPASVVKELLENALDAGASRVVVELERGGIELVRVTDDGCGIACEDLSLAVAAHATSKIATVGDLSHIGTLGFRGEALASIASVSRLSIRSRVPEEAGAWQIEVEGEGEAAPRPCAGPVGTCVSVRNLFFNTPARRKFLRTEATEQERCVETARQIALAHPGVAFRVTADGREAFDVPGGQSPRERVLSLLGEELADQMLEAHADAFDDARGVALYGLVGTPALARGTSKWQYVFVNGRCVRDRTVQHAVAEAYRGLIDPARHPTVVLMLTMSPEAVDVNVHPQKAEVRFRDSSFVHSVVLRAVRDALRGADLTPTFSEIKPGVAGVRDLPGSGQAGQDLGERVARFVDYFRRPAQASQGVLAGDPEPIRYGEAREAMAPAREAELVARPSPSPSVLQVHRSFLVTQDEQGVVIIDQHALHERVMFEYLLRRVLGPGSGGTSSGLERQRLLAPAVVAASAQQVERLADVAPLLERIGIEARVLSPTSIAVDTFPSFLFDRGVEVGEFVESILARAEDLAFLREARACGEAALREVLDMMACKAAVKAGDRLSQSELVELVRLRDEVERSGSCPHGRPTSIRLTIRELEKLFGRT